MPAWQSLRFDFNAMASPCSVLIDGDDEAAMRAAAQAAMAEVRRIEARYSRYQPGSIVSRINVAAGGEPVAIDDETAGLLVFADHLHTLSDGLFDITSGVLRQAWDFRAGRLPGAAALVAARAAVGGSRVQHGDGTVRLPEPGMELDFGGFAKEYAADRAAAVLLQHGCTHAVVNLGGDLHALGPRGLPGQVGEPWQIAIAHPRPETARPDATFAVLPLFRGGLATSGDYERYFIHDGRRYCHVLNPHTGWPVSHWQSVSVLAPTCSAAGAMATIALLKENAATSWLQHQAARYLAVQHDGTVWRDGVPQPADMAHSFSTESTA